MKQVLTNRTLGMLFLIPGLVIGLPALVSGTFSGGIMGFCSFAVLFGLTMILMPEPKAAP